MSARLDFSTFLLYCCFMSWRIYGGMPSIETPEECSGEAALLATRPDTNVLNVAAVISCTNIREGRPTPFFETSTKCYEDSDSRPFVDQVKPIAEMAVRAMCLSCPKFDISQEQQSEPLALQQPQ